MGDEKLELSPEAAADGWEAFDLEGPIYATMARSWSSRRAVIDLGKAMLQVFPGPLPTKQ